MMKGLRTLLDGKQSLFEQGGRLERLSPFYDAVDTFLYAGAAKTPSSPHVRDAMNIKRIMLVFLVALLPVFFMALFNTGFQANQALQGSGLGAPSGWRGEVLSGLSLGTDPSDFTANMVHGALYFLPVLLVSFLANGFWEGLFAVVRRRPISELFFVTPVLFSLLMPPTIPLWQAALGVSVGTVLGKEIFGGLGMNILHPVLVGYAFLFFAYPASISGDMVWVAVDGVTQATPLAEFESPALAVSTTWADAFWGLIPGSMGETSTLACAIGAAILLLAGIASWRIMASILAGMALTALAFNLLGSGTNPMFGVPPLWHLALGGFAFGAVFLATDPATSAVTNTGQYCYGLLIGALAVLIRVVNPAYTEGMMLAILFGNVFAPVFDRAVVIRHIKRRRLRHAR
jgi:Na+-transporting NADH:ubiquinone oxidoreductase subunit B